MDRQREWDEAVRLHFYNQENELFLHGEWVESVAMATMFALHAVFEGNPPEPGKLCNGEDSE